MHIILTLDDLIGIGVISLIIVLILICVIRYFIDKLLLKTGLYKNCLKCKHLKRTDSDINYVYYECPIKNKKTESEYNQQTICAICRHFEQKKEEEDA